MQKHYLNFIIICHFIDYFHVFVLFKMLLDNLALLKRKGSSFFFTKVITYMIDNLITMFLIINFIMSSVYSVSESERNLESSLKDLLEKVKK